MSDNIPGALAFGLCLLVAACTHAEHRVTRPLEERANLVLEPAQVGADTRLVLHIGADQGGTRKLLLGPLAAGELRTFLALDPTSQGFALVELRLQGKGLVARLLADKAAVCRQSWEASEDVGPRLWRECRLKIPRDYPSAELTIRFEATSQAGLMMSSPLIVPARALVKPPVFVLLTDTVRRDVLHTYDPSRATGSALERLAHDSIVFDDLRTPSSWTRTSVASLLTGVLPGRHKVYDRVDVLGATLPTLQSFLQRAGYVTTAWSTNPNVLPMWGFARGFDRFVDVGSHAWAKNKADSNEVFTLVEKALLADPALPNMFYIHLMDAHSPYTPPAELLATVKGDGSLLGKFPVTVSQPDEAEVWFSYQRYVAEIRDLDEQIGAFVDFLKGSGLYEGSLILVVADHGEEFLDHYGVHHGKTLYDEVIRAPAFLKLPSERFAGTHLTGAAELTDMFPTIADALGLAAPSGLEGRSALEFSDRPRPQVSELILDGHRLGALTFEGWKLIVDYAGGHKRLFDLRKDPRERRDRASKEPERVRKLGRMLDTLTARHRPGWHLRACGCGDRRHLGLRLTARGGTPRSVSLEGDDTIKPMGERGYSVDLDLNPTVARREVLGALIEVPVFDEDEVVVEPAGAHVAVAAASASPTSAVLEYALGTGGVTRTRDELRLDGLREKARVAESRPIDCRPGPSAKGAKKNAGAPCTPFVRIWYVGEPQSLPATAVDPSVAERLRALGYVW